MPELTQIYQKSLDESQLCPLCRASMYWIEAEFYHKPLNFHQCSTCQHCVFYGENAQSCQCAKCTQQRKKSVQDAKSLEKKKDWQKRNKFKEDAEVLLDDIPLMDKLFLLSILDAKVDESQPHDENINFEHLYPLQIAPNVQFYRQCKQRLIDHNYLIPLNDSEQLFITQIRLHGYRDPSLLSITQQLRNWFYQDLAQGVPYKNVDEVQDTLLNLLFHEVLGYCQYRSQQLGVQFYSNAHFANSCKLLLKQFSITQIYYWVDRALIYLSGKQLLDPTNQNFINTNLLRKTLMQYHHRSQEQAWEVPNLARPNDLPYSRMSYIFIDRFLKFKNDIFVQPFWKCWQEVLPRLRFFTECHCIQCGHQNLEIEYSTDTYVSFTCSNCKQQDHYFI